MISPSVPYFRDPKHFQHFALSERHRAWGFNTPCLDLDFVLCEYSFSQPVALVDYKHTHSLVHHVEITSGLRTLRNLADSARLPAWIAYYRPESWSFQIWPLNDRARAIFGNERIITFWEDEYVEMLYKLRGIPMPSHVLEACNQTGKSIKTQRTVQIRRLGQKKTRLIAADLCRPKKKAQSKG